jgi:hypothetical protein
MRLCQLQNMSKSLLIKSFCIISLFGCAENPINTQKKEAGKSISAKWLKLPPRFASIEEKNLTPIHPYYDVEWNREEYEQSGPASLMVPYIILTAQDSQFLYGLDMYSGKLFRERAFCEQEDIWGSYSDDLNKPNFTLGLVPRMSDQTQKPQQVIVFSSSEYRDEFKNEFKESIDTYSDARIVGSVIIEHCKTYPCNSKDSWESSQILVGVPAKDSEFAKIESFTSLKNKVNWNYTRAMLTNMHGSHNVGGKYVPAYRILRELSATDTKNMFKKNLFFVNQKGLQALTSWREVCMNLYDTLWDETEKIRKLDHGQKEAFYKYFSDYYTKNSAALFSCQKILRPANILENTRRMWFFSYIQAFVLLANNDYSYSCRENTWTPQFKLDFGRCDSKNFEKSFEQAINGMRLMKTQSNRQYRFVEYDNSAGGSHQPLYAWIYNNSQSHACKNKEQRTQQLFQEIFPQDVEWENFKADDDRLLR